VAEEDYTGTVKNKADEKWKALEAAASGGSKGKGSG
jgi:hypothetical protein